MPRLTLRTLLAYIDDTLEPDQARSLGRKVAESDEAKLLIERIKKVTRRRGLRTPVPDGTADDVADPNTVAAYLSNNLDADQLKQIESTCLDSDVHLAEVAACHQILTLLMTEPVRVPPTANQRMYSLVPSPAADPTRKPGKTIPVGRVTPPSADHVEGDDPDAAFLLGMRRYSASESWAGRMKLVAAVAVIGAFLVFAIYMALPPGVSQPPEIAHNASFAQAPSTAPSTPTVVSTPSTTPSIPTGPGDSKKPADSKSPVEVKTPVESKKEPLPKEKEAPPGVGLGETKIPPPSAGRGEIGKMETPKVIVLSREPEDGSHWDRIDPLTNPKVKASNMVMALPGFKADVKLNSGVVIQLWGNVPEQISLKSMVMQSRVKLYTAPAGFDADFTLDAGRVYLSTSKPGGSKIRVRIASEVWDLELPNDKAKVMVQSHTAFVPGTPYPVGGVGGELPRTEALMVAIRGTPNFEAPTRHMKFAAIKESDAVFWNSKTNKLEPPALVNKIEVLPDQDPLIAGDKGTVVQRVLSEEADALKERDGIRQLLEARMNYARKDDLDLHRMLATYAYATILDGTETEETKKMVANLYDVLNDSERVFVREAAVTSVSAWLARSPSNTSLLVSVLTVDKSFPPEDANLAAQLLRGYSAATYGPAAWLTSKLDDLIKYLNSDFMVIREAALGNLIGYYDIPYTFSNQAVVKLSERAYEALSRTKKLPDPVALKLKGLINKDFKRGDLANELTQLLGKADSEQYQDVIMDFATLRGPFTNVGVKGDDYGFFIKAWESRAIEIKEWMQMRAIKGDTPGKK